MSVDLSTRYLGLTLKNPLVVSACPLTGDLDKLRRLEECGAAAAVLPSLFEEQIEHEQLEIHSLYESQSDAFAESLSYFPEMEDYNTGPHEYLDLIRAAKQCVRIPIIASLNGSSPGRLDSLLREMQAAGADAIELNIYFVPTDVEMTSQEVERRVCRSDRRRAERGHGAVGREGRALLQFRPARDAPVRARRSQWTGAVQSLSWNPTSNSNNSSSRPAWC